jgi:hypothetical protein
LRKPLAASAEEPEFLLVNRPVFVSVNWLRGRPAMTGILAGMEERHESRTSVPLERDSLLALDGQGFDLGGFGPGHLGLRTMRERAAEIGADLSITSAAGESTSVVLVWRDGSSVHDA